MQEPLDITGWHHAYRKASGEEVTLNFYRESMWREFLRYMSQNRLDFTMADLTAVIALRKRRKKEKVYGHQSVAFNALIGSPDLVEEDIGESRGKQRIGKPDNRQRILQAAGMATEKKTEARPIADVAKSALAFEEFKKWREANNL